MTERKPAYSAHSGTTDPHQANYDTALAIEGHYTTLPSKPDILLLIPVLESPYSTQHDPVCLHLVHLDNGDLGLCNTRSTERCPCCMHAVCKLHQSREHALFPDTPEDREARLCETCAALDHATCSYFHTVVVTINASPVLHHQERE
jgi:hypothetical protein